MNVSFTPGAPVNMSKLNDNQAEGTIAIDPTNAQNLFSASMTFHGSLSGKFDPNVNFQDTAFRYHTPGLFAAYSANSGSPNSWNGRVMLTGGPTEASIAERSLPSAYADPQTTFDNYGNLYLTYLSQFLQFGTATAGDANTLTDTSRQWVPNMWAGRILVLRPGKANEEDKIITGNTATQVTVNAAWTTPPAAGDVYDIQSGTLVGSPPRLVPANSLVVLLSTDDGQSFQFLKILDSGSPPTPVDYPGVATGPGRNTNEQSVWLAWRGSNGQVLAAGAPVTAKGAVGTFIANEVVNGSDDMGVPRVQVGPNGQVMVSFVSVGANPNILVNVDDTGLGTGGFRATPITVTQTTVPLNPNSPQFIIPAQPNRGISPAVSLAWDRSGTYTAAPNGRVYLVYTYLFGTADTDIFVRYSDDSGVSWSNPTLINNSGNSQFLPSISVDQTNGDVALVWLDAQDDPANVKVKLYGTVSGDGGATYLPSAAIAQGQSDARNTNAPQRGFTTGSNTDTTLNDLDQNWVPNNYWVYSHQVSVPSVGDPRDITASTATRLTVDPSWISAPCHRRSLSDPTDSGLRPPEHLQLRLRRLHRRGLLQRGVLPGLGGQLQQHER